MTATSPAEIKKTDPANNLFAQVIAWLEEGDLGWQIEPNAVVRSDPYGRKNVPDVLGLAIEVPKKGRIHLEPLGTDKDGHFLVEMYAWPTLIRVQLREQQNSFWEIETDMGIPFHTPWNRDTFLTLATDLLKAR